MSLDSPLGGSVFPYWTLLWKEEIIHLSERQSGTCRLIVIVLQVLQLFLVPIFTDALQCLYCFLSICDYASQLLLQFFSFKSNNFYFLVLLQFSSNKRFWNQIGTKPLGLELNL